VRGGNVRGGVPVAGDRIPAYIDRSPARCIANHAEAGGDTTQNRP
jgi:hypothetical protein